MTPRDAMNEAESRDLDLVEVAPNAKPPKNAPITASTAGIS